MSIDPTKTESDFSVYLWSDFPFSLTKGYSLGAISDVWMEGYSRESISVPTFYCLVIFSDFHPILGTKAIPLALFFILFRAQRL